MNFNDLQVEFYARGFDYLQTTAAGVVRAKMWLNQANQELCDIEPWPFLTATATGPAPLAISDLGTIESVIDTDQLRKLRPIDRRLLTSETADLTTTGSPSVYYVADDATVSTYPVGGTLQVFYWRAPVDMVSDTDTTLVPKRFHDVIVHIAAKRAYLDDDNYEAAQALQAEIDRRVQTMREAVLWLGHDDPDVIFAGYESGDW